MIKNLAKLTIAAVVVITALAAYQITTLRFDYEFEHFFPSDDPELDHYQEFKDKFSTDVDFVLIALRNERGIFDKDFLLQANKMRDELATVEEVRRITSPFDVASYALGPFGPIAIPYLHVGQEALYKSDSTKIYKYNKGVGSLFSADGKSVALVIEIEPNLSKLETDTVYVKLREVIDQFEFDALHLAGKVVGQAYYIEQIKFEFTLFFSLSVLLVIIVLLLVYRSLWGVMVPLLIVMLSVIWLLGLMGWLGKPVDIMTVLLPLILFVVGISDVIHLLSKYFEEIRNGNRKSKAIGIAYRQVGMATFLTSLTTAIGFLTLLTSGIKPVRELGIYAAAGVFIAFILAFSLLPAILILTRVPKLAYREPSHNFWNKLVRKFFYVSIHHASKVLACTVIVVLVSVILMTRIEVNNYLLEDVGKDDPMRSSFEYFESHFAGARPFEMHLKLSDSNDYVFSRNVVAEMQRIERYLIDEYGVGFVVSPLNILRTAHQAMHGGHDSAYAIPGDSAEFTRLVREVGRFQKRPEFGALITPNLREARISGKTHDNGGLKTKELNEAMTAYFTDVEPLKSLTFKLTGMALLIDKNNEQLSVNMLTGLVYALLIVAIIMGLLFRSWKMALIALIPNMLPLLVVAGVMGAMGIDLKVSTSIIFGIAFGIAVDDSIHFLSKFKLELAKSNSVPWALRRTAVSTGKAIILTSLILCVGFLTLIFSDFTSTYYVGLLISITLAVAVMADLLLLPLLLRYLIGKKAVA